GPAPPAATMPASVPMFSLRLPHFTVLSPPDGPMYYIETDIYTNHRDIISPKGTGTATLPPDMPGK
ncbi:hypothetical protein, partial [Komagataeibacter intermedius]|uniref:hypothetical protein n=1 Tax=Komagataeibacter intermedius TaxID=66229 RepID=UPI002230ABA0